MAWAKLDDHFDDDPDIDIIGPVGVCLFVCSVTWASRNLTDGFIPAARVAKLTGGADAKAVEALTRCGWWEPSESGFQIRNYLKYNPSAEKVRAEQNAAKDRMNRLRSGNVRANEHANSTANSQSTNGVRSASPVSRIPYSESYVPEEDKRGVPPAADAALLPCDEPKGRNDETDLPSKANPAPLEEAVVAAPKDKQKRFIPPTPEEVTAYMAERGFRDEGERFCAHHDTRGWMTGVGNKRSKMIDWKGAVRYWISNAKIYEPQRNAPLKRSDIYCEEAYIPMHMRGQSH